MILIFKLKGKLGIFLLHSFIYNDILTDFQLINLKILAVIHKLVYKAVIHKLVYKAVIHKLDNLSNN